MPQSIEKPALYVIGMHGFGDSLHERAVVRHLSKRYSIYLETSWPQIFHDMPELHLIAKGTRLRTQLKNADAQREKFYHGPIPAAHALKISYRPQMVGAHGGVLRAMMRDACPDASEADYDFHLPVPQEWRDKAASLVKRLGISKPIMLYRPLVERTEWSGCPNRNPDYAAYRDLFSSVRDDYFVISLADIVPGVEWIAGHDIKADAEFHRGELDFETIAGLMSMAALAWGSPGFLIVLARSIGTPVICVFGGYEDSSSFTMGHGPYLGIDTIQPCQCFSHTHQCVKEIDIPRATTKIRKFLDVSPAAKD